MEFGLQLRVYREQAGLSQRDLANASGCDAASINRFESGKRNPSERSLVEGICDALGLGERERDDLLWSAGFLPGVYEGVPPTDPTLMLVARVLQAPELSEGERAEFRTVVETIARRWAATGGTR